MTPSLIDEARRRLWTGAAFVGLVENWDQSVCLFHKLMGGLPREQEMRNVHRGVGKRGEARLYDTSLAVGWHDEADEALYEEAKVVFEWQMKRAKRGEAGLPLREAPW